jgi:hypothetical protein
LTAPKIFRLGGEKEKREHSAGRRSEKTIVNGFLHVLIECGHQDGFIRTIKTLYNPRIMPVIFISGHYCLAAAIDLMLRR